MSLPSASGDEQYEDSKPQTLYNGSGPSNFQFLGGLPHPRFNSEQLQDSTPGDTPSSLSLPGMYEELDGEKAPPAREARKSMPAQRIKSHTPAASRPEKLEHDKKPHAAKTKCKDHKLSTTESSSEGFEDDSDEDFTVYDAVAGRLGYDGLVKPNQQPIAASDYLFRHQKGPEYDESYELFAAHRHLQHRLPDSDLLKAIHAHASDFYGALPDGQDSFESMDETALIAMGVLLEEATAEGLGDTGDLAFVEAASLDEADRQPPVERKTKRQKIKHEVEVKIDRGLKAESESTDEKSSLDDRGPLSGKKRRREAAAAESYSWTEEKDEEEDAKPADEGPSHNSDVESWISQTLLDSQGQTSSHFGSPAGLPFR